MGTPAGTWMSLPLSRRSCLSVSVLLAAPPPPAGGAGSSKKLRSWLGLRLGLGLGLGLGLANPNLGHDQPRARLPRHHLVPQPVPLQRQLLGRQLEQLRRHLQPPGARGGVRAPGAWRVHGSRRARWPGVGMGLG